MLQIGRRSGGGGVPTVLGLLAVWHPSTYLLLSSLLPSCRITRPKAGTSTQKGSAGKTIGAAAGAGIGFGVGGFAIGSIDGIAAGIALGQKGGREYATWYIQTQILSTDFQATIVASLAQSQGLITSAQSTAIKNKIIANRATFTKFIRNDQWWGVYRAILTSFLKSSAAAGFVGGTAAGVAIGTDTGAFYGALGDDAAKIAAKKAAAANSGGGGGARRKTQASIKDPTVMAALAWGADSIGIGAGTASKSRPHPPGR